jgi:hypothetical protein
MKKTLTPEQREAKNKRDRESKARRKAAAKKPAKPSPKAKPATKKPPLPVKVKLAGGKTLTVPASAKISQNGFTRPKPVAADGSPKITHRVWQIADEISAENKKNTPKFQKAKPASRQQVLTVCEAEGIKYSTFSNQFYRWRKFNGLFGRVKKDGTIAAVTGGPRRGAQAGSKPKAKKPPLPAKKPAAKAAPNVKAPAKAKAPAKSKPKAKKKPAAPAPVVATTPAAPAVGETAPLPFPVPAVAAGA